MQRTSRCLLVGAGLVIMACAGAGGTADGCDAAALLVALKRSGGAAQGADLTLSRIKCDRGHAAAIAHHPSSTDDAAKVFFELAADRWEMAWIGTALRSDWCATSGFGVDFAQCSELVAHVDGERQVQGGAKKSSSSKRSSRSKKSGSSGKSSRSKKSGKQPRKRNKKR